MMKLPYSSFMKRRCKLPRVNGTNFLDKALDTWLVLSENRPLWGWKERFTHPCVTMIILWASLQADIFWLPDKFLVLLTPNMHAFFNISTNWGSFHYAKITLFSNPEEGDFLTTRVTSDLLNVFKWIWFEMVSCCWISLWIPLTCWSLNNDPSFSILIDVWKGNGQKLSCPSIFICFVQIFFPIKS